MREFALSIRSIVFPVALVFSPVRPLLNSIAVPFLFGVRHPCEDDARLILDDDRVVYFLEADDVPAVPVRFLPTASHARARSVSISWSAEVGDIHFSFGLEADWPISGCWGIGLCRAKFVLCI